MKLSRIVIFLLFLFIYSFAFSQTEVDEKLAVQFYQDKQYEKAAELFGRIFKKNPKPYYYNYYIESLFALQDYKTAEKFTRDMTKNFPTDQKYKVELGYVLVLSGQTKKSEKQFESAIKDLKSDREEYISLSNAFRNRNLNEYALKTLQKGKKEIKDQPMNFELAELYQILGNYNSMIQEYLDLVENSDEYLNIVQAKLQLIIADERNENITQALKNELLLRVNKFPQKTIYSELLYWFSIQKKEFKLALMQSKSLDRQFNEQGNRVFQLGNILLENEEYDLAQEAFLYILTNYESNQTLNHTSNVLLLKTKYLRLIKGGKFTKEELTQLKTEYEKGLQRFGKNATTVELMTDLSDIYSFYLNQTEPAIALLEEILKLPRLDNQTLAKTKLKLGDVLLFAGQNWDANILYQQVEKDFKNDPIGFEAKFKTAQFFYYVGEMEWSKVQLDVLKAATAKLIANDAMELSLLISENNDVDSSFSVLKTFAKADLLIYQKQFNQALDSLNYIETNFKFHSIQDKVLMRKATIYIETSRGEDAEKQWLEVLKTYPFATMGDNACIELARFYDKAANQSKAQEYYQKILVDYPGSLFTIEARKRYRELRGS